MGIHRRGFLEAAAGAAMLAATGGVGVAGPARAEAPTAAQRRTLLTGSNAPGDHPPGWSPRDSSGAIIDLAATKIALVEPHLDDKEIFLPALLPILNLYHVYGVIPQSPGAVAASFDSLRPGGPFRPKDSAAIVQTPFQNAYFGAFDQDWYSHNVIPLRIEDPAERLAALARRDAIYADPLVLRNRLRPALYQLAVHGVTKFFTLNPAGTYGHPHHSALSEAVADLAVEISEQHGISVEVWNDATLRRQPADPDPTGQILWHQAIDIPGAHYIGPFPVPEDNVLSALYESYLPRHIDEELGVSTHTWHKDGRDILVNDNNGPYPPGQYFFLRVGHNPVTGKIDDVMKRAGDEYEAMRAFWHEVKRNIIPPTYLGNPRVMRQALQERWAYEPLGTEPAESFGQAPILAPVL